MDVTQTMDAPMTGQTPMTGLEAQQAIVEDCHDHARFWQQNGRPDRADFWLQLAANALEVMRGIEMYGDDYVPF